MKVKERPRILTIGKYLPPPYGGIEKHIEDLHDSLNSSCQLTLIAASQSDCAPSTLRSYGVRKVPSFGAVASVPMAPGYISACLELINRRHTDLVHVHVPNPWGDAAIVLARLRKLPSVLTWHSDIVRQRLLRRLYRPFQLTSIGLASRIIVPTPMHLSSSMQLDADALRHKIRFVPLGIDTETLHKLPTELLQPVEEELLRDRRVVLAVGRHVTYKGFEYLVDAVADLPSDVIAVIAGEGPLSQALKTQAQERGVSSRVLFPGRLTPGQLAGLYRRCEVFCLPSVSQAEAFGLATAEAMSFAKPAVVCELNNGVNYLNRHGYTGLTVPPRDSRALASALREMLENDSLRIRLGLQARDWVRQEFSRERMRDGVLAVYGELL